MYGTIIQIPSLFYGKVNIMLNLLSSVVIFTSHVDILKCFSDKMLYMHEIEEDMLEVTQLPITGWKLGVCQFSQHPCIGDLTMEYEADMKNQTLQVSETPNSTLHTHQQVFSQLWHFLILSYFQHCDVTTGVETSDKKLFLCLSFKSFLDHEILARSFPPNNPLIEFISGMYYV